jgi:hypothetical protein
LSRRCLCCTSRDLAAVDRLLIDGTPIRTISRIFGLSRYSLQRHRDLHVPAELLRARDAERVLQAGQLAEELMFLRRKAVKVLAGAELDADEAHYWRARATHRRVLLLAVHELARLAELGSIEPRIVALERGLADRQAEDRPQFTVIRGGQA